MSPETEKHARINIQENWQKKNIIKFWEWGQAQYIFLVLCECMCVYLCIVSTAECLTWTDTI